MLKTRIIPSLLLQGGGLVKTVGFKNARYVGDPINAIKIFNDKEVDELAVIDIDASRSHTPPKFNLLDRLNKEAFMPLAYGGGIKTLEEVRRILGLGFEKVIIDSIALERPEFITEAASVCGSQSIVVCIDIKKDLFGRLRVYDYLRKKCLTLTAQVYAAKLEKMGAGEIIVYSVDRDGTYAGYEIKVMREITSKVNVPVIALGGAGKIQDLAEVVTTGGASAAAAGSIFVFHGPNRAVLITYPERSELEKILP
jgi:cyclase